jgi:hypothetical protein
MATAQNHRADMPEKSMLVSIISVISADDGMALKIERIFQFLFL